MSLNSKAKGGALQKLQWVRYRSLSTVRTTSRNLILNKGYKLQTFIIMCIYIKQLADKNCGLTKRLHKLSFWAHTGIPK